MTGCAKGGETPVSTAPVSSSPCASIETFGCDRFTSISGIQNGSAVSWLGTEPLLLSFSYQNGSINAIVGTPCNAINVPVQISGDKITPDANSVIHGAKGCVNDAGQKEMWATTFFSTPMSVVSTDSVLTLSTSTASVVFSRATS
ncbi:hypothetical protein GCM10009563_14440 [Subtercola frigoramans]